jgi:hypothetical protein
MRKSSLFFGAFTLQLFVLSLLLTHASVSERVRRQNLAEKATMVQAFRLTDLCLFTEARYTRNLSQADLNSPFQDHPLSLEHFPSGSFTQPPKGLSTRP